MLTKGAIGNLVNRYRAVLKKCNLMNTFGSLAVASMLVMGGAGVASAATDVRYDGTSHNVTLNDYEYSTVANSTAVRAQDGAIITLNKPSDSSTVTVTAHNSGASYGLMALHKGAHIHVSENIDLLNIDVSGTDARGIHSGCCATHHTFTQNVNIDAKNTVIKSTGIGICAMSFSSVNINGGLELTAEDAIYVRGESTVNINNTENKDHIVKIKGNIGYGYDYPEQTYNPNLTAAVTSNVNIVLNGEASSWEGNAYLYWGKSITELATQDISGLNITIQNGARWIPTRIEGSGDSTSGDKLVGLNNLTLNEGIIEIHEDVTAKTDVLSGSGGEIRVEDASKLGTFIAGDVASNTNLNVQAIDKDGNIMNADQVSAERLAELQKQVQNAEGEALATTASAAEGDVNGAISIDKNGNVSTAKNTLMDAALKQASITTVALDKILTNDVRKRLGDIRSDKNQTGVWMRWDGGKLKGDGLTNNFNTIQIGGDTKVGTNCRIGVAGSFTHGDTDFARGNGELEGFSFALYSTWMGENGMFADIVTRLGHFSNEMNVEGRKGDMDNRVFSLSGEYGWRFDLCKQFFLEPQVELAYTYVSSDDLQLDEARYAFDNVNSLVGRAGLVAGWNLPDDMGNVYARASVLQQLMGDAKISGSNGNAFNVQEIDGNDTWLEYGIGANIKLTDKTYIWADVERTAGADLDEEWRGTVGLRYSF